MAVSGPVPIGQLPGQLLSAAALSWPWDHWQGEDVQQGHLGGPGLLAWLGRLQTGCFAALQFPGNGPPATLMQQGLELLGHDLAQAVVPLDAFQQENAQGSCIEIDIDGRQAEIQI